jgi:hypothetical protein
MPRELLLQFSSECLMASFKRQKGFKLVDEDIATPFLSLLNSEPITIRQDGSVTEQPRGEPKSRIFVSRVSTQGFVIEFLEFGESPVRREGTLVGLPVSLPAGFAERKRFVPLVFLPDGIRTLPDLRRIPEAVLFGEESKTTVGFLGSGGLLLYAGEAPNECVDYTENILDKHEINTFTAFGGQPGDKLIVNDAAFRVEYVDEPEHPEGMIVRFELDGRQTLYLCTTYVKDAEDSSLWPVDGKRTILPLRCNTPDQWFMLEDDTLVLLRKEQALTLGRDLPSTKSLERLPRDDLEELIARATDALVCVLHV